jgi:regulator of sirC expression with transglutaminase-like and TPR domain
MSVAPPKLHHLLKLLDDESPVVREAVRSHLAPIRHRLPEQLLQIGESLTEEQEDLLEEILAPVCREELETTWLSWKWLSTPESQLEQALGQLSAFLSGWQCESDELGRRLDALADLAARRRGVVDERALAEFLFGGRGHEARLRGNSKDYYAVNNSNLLWVLGNSLGNPISLCCIYILVGHRLGLKIQGCNFPGHFLARLQHDGKMWLVDCFNRGRFMLAEDVAKHHPAANASMEEVICEPTTVDAIVGRVLRNLDEAFAREENRDQRKIVRRLILRLMEGN